MATTAYGALYRSSHVSEVMHSRSQVVPYAVRMPNRISSDTAHDAPDEQPTARFARIIRTAREQRGWTQDELADNSGVGRATIQRYENGKTSTPQPAEARKIFLTLGLQPALIPVILGYVTPEEVGAPLGAPEVLMQSAEEAIRILKDPSVPAAAKEEWLAFLQFRVKAAIEASQAPHKHAS